MLWTEAVKSGPNPFDHWASFRSRPNLSNPAVEAIREMTLLSEALLFTVSKRLRLTGMNPTPSSFSLWFENLYGCLRGFSSFEHLHRRQPPSTLNIKHICDRHTINRAERERLAYLSGTGYCGTSPARMRGLPRRPARWRTPALRSTSPGTSLRAWRWRSASAAVAAPEPAPGSPPPARSLSPPPSSIA